MLGVNTKKSFFNTFALAILVIVFFTTLYFFLQPQTAFLTVHFYDVGQGDSALISTPAGQNILIDGGPNDTILTKLDQDIPFYQRRIDAIILSHPHADHLDGLLSVLAKFEVKDLYFTGVIHTTPEYIEFLEILKKRNIPTHVAIAGSELELGDGIRIVNYFPLTDLAGAKVDNLNNSSVVSKLIWGDSAVLFTGDLEKEGQSQLLNTKPDLKADILKVPHHGSKDSGNPDLIKAVAPEYAVISVGKDNKFGHPAGSTLRMLFSSLFKIKSKNSSPP